MGWVDLRAHACGGSWIFGLVRRGRMGTRKVRLSGSLERSVGN